MVLRCSIVAANILLVLISTPAVVEGTNKCILKCVHWSTRPQLSIGPGVRCAGQVTGNAKTRSTIGRLGGHRSQSVIHSVFVILLAIIVTVVNIIGIQAPAVGVTVVVKNLEEHWGILQAQNTYSPNSSASVRDKWPI